MEFYSIYRVSGLQHLEEAHVSPMLWSLVSPYIILSMFTCPHWSLRKNRWTTCRSWITGQSCLTPEPMFLPFLPAPSPAHLQWHPPWLHRTGPQSEPWYLSWRRQTGLAVLGRRWFRHKSLSPLSQSRWMGGSQPPLYEWGGLRWVAWRALQAEFQERGHQKGQYLSMGKSKPWTTHCCSFCLKYPSTGPGVIILSKSHNQFLLLCLFQQAQTDRPSPPLPHPPLQALEVWPSPTTLPWFTCHPSLGPVSGRVSCPQVDQGPGALPTGAVWCVLWRETNTETGPKSPPMPLTAVGSCSLARFSSGIEFHVFSSPSASDSQNHVCKWAFSAHH